MKLRFPAFVLSCLFMTASPASARWLEARSANFIVYSEGSEKALRDSTALLEDYDALLRTLTGTSAPPSRSPLKVYLVDTAAKLREVADVPAQAAGFYSARVGGTAAFAVRSNDPLMDGQEILLHEYAHHFTNRYYPAWYPGWYSEGLAEYLSTARILPDRIEIGRYNPGRAITLLRGTWLPAERVLAPGRKPISKGEMGQFYAESWLIVHYLFATEERKQALVRYLADLHRGVAEETAFRSAFAMDHRAFDQQLRLYMGGRIAYGTMRREATSTPAIAIKPLPDSADAVILPHAALTIGIPRAEREQEILAAARQAAARFPDDPYAQRVLARAEINSGDRARGTTLIETLIEKTPHDPELLYIRGTADFYTGRKDAAVRAERFAAARPWFARAVEADPAYYTALYRLAQTTPPGSGDEVALEQLRTAHELAPLVGDIAIDTTSALMARKRYAEALAVIQPVATNPHGGNAARAAALYAEVRTALADQAESQADGAERLSR
ncbi:MAG: hypothetical protein QM690_21890 [Sphingobium sp.]